MISRNTPMPLDSFSLPPATWSRAELSSATLLDLGTVPVQPGALALVAHLTPLVAAHDGRKRRPSDLVKLNRAVGAVVGGVLHQWRKGRAVFRSREAVDFTGELVGIRSFVVAVNGLIGLGQLAVKGSISYAIDFGDGLPGSTRRAARLRPTERLLNLAAEHGIGPGNVAEQFGLEFSRQPPRVPATLVEQRPLRMAYRVPRTPSTPPPVGVVRPDHDTAQRLSLAVYGANQFIAGFEVGGCLPPRWRRTFRSSWLLGGRWMALGSSGVYQRLSKAERAAITINGAPTAELDIVASHLSIMHGLLGLPLPGGDLYAIPGVPRPVVKRWITATLGAGSARGRSWPRGAVAEQPELQPFKAWDVGAAVIGHYPFLADPAGAVVDAAGLRDLADLGTPARLLTHRLIGLEAAGMTAALAELRRQGVPALPVHDSLIVPVGDVGAAERALEVGFAEAAGAAIRTRIG